MGVNCLRPSRVVEILVFARSRQSTTCPASSFLELRTTGVVCLWIEHCRLPRGLKGCNDALQGVSKGEPTPRGRRPCSAVRGDASGLDSRATLLMRRQRLGLLTDVKPPATPETVPGLFSLELCQQRSRQGSGYLAPLIHNYGSAANSDRKGSVSTTLAAAARGRIECRLRISLLTR